VVKDRSSDQLDIKMSHTNDTATGLAHDSKRFGQEIV
jgi:hypothetical protein